jgi:hypothetical protein
MSTSHRGRGSIERSQNRSTSLWCSPSRPWSVVCPWCAESCVTFESVTKEISNSDYRTLLCWGRLVIATALRVAPCWLRCKGINLIRGLARNYTSEETSVIEAQKRKQAPKSKHKPFWAKLTHGTATVASYTSARHLRLTQQTKALPAQ